MVYELYRKRGRKEYLYLSLRKTLGNYRKPNEHFVPFLENQMRMKTQIEWGKTENEWQRRTKTKPT